MPFQFKSYKDVALKGKKVLLRADINSPIDAEKKKIKESTRIKALVPALEELKDSAVVVMAHQGRPGDKDYSSLSLHFEELKKLIKRPVKFVADVFGEKAIKAIKDLKVGEILLLENVRSWEPENKEVKDFKEAEKLEMIQKLAPLFDYVIQDAFGAAHRAQPSIVGWPKMLAGPTAVKEFETMNKLLEKPVKPVTMLIGGAKAIDKYNAMKYNLDNNKIDYALCAGLTAVLIFEGIGINTGEPNKQAIAKDLEKLKDDVKKTYEKYKAKIILPKDLVIDDKGKRKTISVDEMKKYNVVTGDIGEKTIKEFKDIIMKSKTIIANGPPGIFEKEVFFQGSKELTLAMVEATKKNKALTVIGGGEMGAVAEILKVDKDVSYVSTGGGAMLEILSGKDVPMAKALRKKKP
jgi:phosphoglycerate kinase